MIRLKSSPKVAESHYLLLKTRIQTRARNILLGRIGTTGDRPDINPNIEAYLQSLRDDDETLHHLITAPADQLRGIIANYQQHYYVAGSAVNDLRVLYNLFIESVYDKTSHFNKLNFIKDIDLDTCVYCNRSYIYYLSGMADSPIKPEIDHFYPKSIYPYLGLSFYNLIPSCSTCNSPDAKGALDPVDEDLINPYELDSDSQFLFTYKINTIDALRPLSHKYDIQVKLKYKIDGHNEIFKLEKLYEQHSDHVLELIVKSKGRYAEAFRRYLQSYSELKFDDFEIDRLILGNYASIKEVNKRPLAKLYQDIGRELKLIK